MRVVVTTDGVVVVTTEGVEYCGVTHVTGTVGGSGMTAVGGQGTGSEGWSPNVLALPLSVACLNKVAAGREKKESISK